MPSNRLAVSVVFPFSGTIRNISRVALLLVIALCCDVVARSPAPVTDGGDVLEGRIYFACGSHLFSFALRP